MEPSTPLTACSMGIPTVLAMTSALAPGYIVVTWMVGGTISGYCATGKVNRHTSPRMTVTMAMTLAKIGRSMKNSEIMGRLS